MYTITGFEYPSNFKGVFIENYIYANADLTLMDKLLLCEIMRLDTPQRGCFASDKYLSEYCQTSVSTLKRSLKHLKDLGYVKTVFNDGTERILRVNRARLRQEEDAFYEYIGSLNMSEPLAQYERSPRSQNEFLLKEINREKNIDTNTTPGVVVQTSEISKTRNHRHSKVYQDRTPLEDVFSGESYAEEAKPKKQKQSVKEQCLAIIDKNEYGFTEMEQTLLRKFMEYATVKVKGKTVINSKARFLEKLGDLILLRHKGENVTDVINQTLSHKWYGFFEVSKKQSEKPYTDPAQESLRGNKIYELSRYHKMDDGRYIYAETGEYITEEEFEKMRKEVLSSS